MASQSVTWATMQSDCEPPTRCHLAIGANNKAESIFTLDKRLLVAGSAWGLPMSAGIEG